MVRTSSEARVAPEYQAIPDWLSELPGLPLADRADVIHTVCVLSLCEAAEPLENLEQEMIRLGTTLVIGYSA